MPNSDQVQPKDFETTFKEVDEMLEVIYGENHTLKTEAKQMLLEAHNQALAQSARKAAIEARWETDHVLTLLEAGKDLSISYQKYGGDMDWVEFIETYFIPEAKKQDSELRGAES